MHHNKFLIKDKVHEECEWRTLKFMFSRISPYYRAHAKGHSILRLFGSYVCLGTQCLAVLHCIWCIRRWILCFLPPYVNMQYQSYNGRKDSGGMCWILQQDCMVKKPIFKPKIMFKRKIESKPREEVYRYYSLRELIKEKSWTQGTRFSRFVLVVSWIPWVVSSILAV